jgi:hypothetical protein
MKHLHEIKQKLVKELDEIAERGELSAGSLDTLHKLTDTIKNIDKIEMLEGGGGGNGYRGSYADGGSYGDGYSQARHRDSRGRYTSYDGGNWTAEGSYDGGSYADESYDRGYSGRRRHYVRGHYSYAEAKSDITEQLHELMQEANGKEREAIQRCIKMLDD